jgi:hypothetical protein
MQELLAIQQQGPRAIGFFGTRNMGFMHQELIEILSYAMVITVRCYNLNSVYLVWNFGYTLSTSDVSILYVLDLLHDSCYLLDNLQKNHIFTSGASGTNAAVIRGALRAEKPELLTVILPQSLKKQSPESQELLSKVRVWLCMCIMFILHLASSMYYSLL